MNRQYLKLWITLVGLFPGIGAESQTILDNQMPSFRINLGHLHHLTETVVLQGKTCDIIHIYSDYPDYQRVDASQEGIACVDDAARAVVFYLRYFEITRRKSLLENARRLLNFIRVMQTEDGEFYNFIDSNLTINKTGVTSRKSFKFWAARGYWALGLGFRIFQTEDPQYAAELRTAFLKCQPPLKQLLKNYPKFKEINHIQYPQWLLQKTAADATAEFLLGLTEFLKVEPLPALRSAALKLAEGLIAMQLPDSAHFPGAFLSWINTWHAWGNAQTQALAALGTVLEEKSLIQAAEKEAQYYSAPLLIDGLLREWQIGTETNPQRFPQIAYDIRCLALGLLRLAEATTNDDFAILAGLAASWLTGNNVAQTPMYQPATGRCYDGINDTTQVNLNAGAESTIEALYTLIEITNHPLAAKYLFYTTLERGTIIDQPSGQLIKYRLFQNQSDQKIVLLENTSINKWQLLTGERMMQFWKKLNQRRVKE